jgi:hypothetical protein
MLGHATAIGKSFTVIGTTKEQDNNTMINAAGS